MEHMASVCQHDVVIMSVTDTQDEGNNTPASTGMEEIPYCLIDKKKEHKCLCVVPTLKPSTSKYA